MCPTDLRDSRGVNRRCPERHIVMVACGVLSPDETGEAGRSTVPKG